MLDEFIRGLHESTKILSFGTAEVIGHKRPAVEVYQSLYGQTVVWGAFNTHKGKFKGTQIANDTNTEGVKYTPLQWNPDL